MPKYRSGLEEKAAKILKDWKYEPFTLPYTTHRNYKPDFVKGNVLIEAKGFFRAGDTAKYKAIRDSQPEYLLVFLFSDPHKKIRKGAKMTLAQWCEKEGFDWYTLDTIDL